LTEATGIKKGNSRRKLRSFCLEHLHKCIWRPTFKTLYWFLIWDGKRPALDYSKTATTGFIAVFGTFTTISMAFGFSKVGFGWTRDILDY